MEQSVMIGLAVALVFFVWVWIGLTIVQRMSLEQKIEKLENIENRLPEEQRSLDHFIELRAIEKNKIGSAKLTVAFFGVLLLAALGLGTFDAKVQDVFGFENLKVFSYFAIIALSFIVLPTFVGLTLASGGRSAVRKKVVTESK
ncbi:MAG TPA: hypothetical protein VK914_02340 [bacterium]|jgi:hypothetical protein|nr:hypothetical protein [bacterium]